MKFNMAEKRVASSELNHLNWDKEEEPEKIGTFQTASEEELKRRVVKKARRKLQSPTDNNETPSVFIGFSGFKSSSAPTVSASKTFSFLKDIASNESKKSKIDNSTVFSKNGTDSSKIDYSQLKCLNQTVAEWIKKHVDENPLCILTPIFKEYEDYMKLILNDKKKEEKATSSSLQNSEEKPKLFSFGTQNSTDKSGTLESTKFPSPSPSKSFSFGSAITKSSANEISSQSNIFSTANSPISSNIFGNPSGNFQSNPSVTNTLTPTPVTGFSFTNSKAFTFAANVTESSSNHNQNVQGNEEAEKEENEEPPKNEFKAVVEEDSVYNKRCKVFVKSDGNFADRGCGTLYLKPIKETGKTQLLVRADTNLGNILLNFILSSLLPTKRLGKNNVMVVCLPTPESEKPTSVLIRVKTGEDADELLETINKYKK